MKLHTTGYTTSLHKKEKKPSALIKIVHSFILAVRSKDHLVDHLVKDKGIDIVRSSVHSIMKFKSQRDNFGAASDWFLAMACLVPVRRFPSPSRSIRFGDVSEANGRGTPHIFAWTT